MIRKLKLLLISLIAVVGVLYVVGLPTLFLTFALTIS